VNENSAASLGAVAGTGLLLGLLILIFPIDRLAGDYRVRLFAGVNILFILLCTVGGFSSIIAYTVTPMIRAWNRASIFISFGSLMLCLLLLDRCLWTKIDRRRLPWLPPTVAVALMTVGVLDQAVPYCRSCIEGARQAYRNDLKFATMLEQMLPAGSGIYQLPYMPMPETPKLVDLPDYGHFEIQLHSKQLKWSYGGMKGRAGDLFFRKLAGEPIAAQVDTLLRWGFKAIVVDRRGYVDRGSGVESAISTVTAKPPLLLSADGHLSAFELAPRPRPQPR
jgi:phosphoglycerol transferase